MKSARSRAAWPVAVLLSFVLVEARPGQAPPGGQAAPKPPALKESDLIPETMRLDAFRLVCASEVFAAFIQERGRGVVVGRPSNGGVLNSTQLELPTGGVLQYPHSDMTTPNGRRIEGRGVIPDIAVELRRTDLLAGKDTVLERAIQAVSGGSGL